MKRAQVSIQLKDGLHLRPATRLVKRAMAFQSTIWLKSNEKIANARSILSILLLCATLGTLVELEASGSDEDQALDAIASILQSEDGSGLPEVSGEPGDMGN